MKKHVLILSIFCFAFPYLTFANEKSEIEEALRMTQQMLKDPKARQEKMNSTSKGKATGQNVKEIAGSEANEQAIYELASEIFANLVKETNGNPEKIQALLDEGLKNPEAFANKWSPEELEKLNKISKSTPASTTEMNSYKAGSETAAQPAQPDPSSTPRKGPAIVREKPIRKPSK